MATKIKIKKGDLVQILAGKDRGKQGRIIEARPRDGRVLVENLNVMTRHTRPKPLRDSNRMGGTQMAPGGRIEKAAPVDVSNVMLVCPVCTLPTRVGMKVKEIKGETVRVRVCKRDGCGQEVDKYWRPRPTAPASRTATPSCARSCRRSSASRRSCRFPRSPRSR